MLYVEGLDISVAFREEGEQIGETSEQLDCIFVLIHQMTYKIMNQKRMDFSCWIDEQFTFLLYDFISKKKNEFSSIYYIGMVELITGIQSFLHDARIYGEFIMNI